MAMSSPGERSRAGTVSAHAIETWEASSLEPMQVTLPDGNVLELDEGATGHDAAAGGESRER